MDNQIAVDEELTAGLARAIYNDITTLSSDKFLTSNAKYLGSVAFCVKSQGEDYSMYESSEYVNATSVTDETVEEEVIPRQEIVDALSSHGPASRHLALSCGFSVVPITEEMTNTISFLKAH